jgi:X-X-X-Leu-X-X-Gly heptad repeat protein
MALTDVSTGAPQLQDGVVQIGDELNAGNIQFCRETGHPTLTPPRQCILNPE